MTPYTGKLPQNFKWIYHQDPSDSAVSVTLVLDRHELAIVKPMGLAWVAVVNQVYSPGGYPLCVVANRHRGQAWVAKWLRRSSIGIKNACMIEDIALPNQPQNGPVSASSPHARHWNYPGN